MATGDGAATEEGRAHLEVDLAALLVLDGLEHEVRVRRRVCNQATTIYHLSPSSLPLIPLSYPFQ